MLTNTIDAYGRVTLSMDALCELLMRGGDHTETMVTPCPEADRFNRNCEKFDKSEKRVRAPETPDHSPEEEHARRQAEWMFPDEYKTIDVRAVVLARCETDAQRARVSEEMDLYESNDLVMVLRLMIFLVDHWREHEVLLGVGRGSSVASYVLYLLKVHRIDSIKYGLNIRDFLRVG